MQTAEISSERGEKRPKKQNKKMVMPFALSSPTSSYFVPLKALVKQQRPKSSSIILISSSPKTRSKVRVKAFFFNPADEPIIGQALKEPVAFAGGIFAGLLRLDLNEEPLKEWLITTVESSGITEDEIDAESTQKEETPQQIEIE